MDLSFYKNKKVFVTGHTGFKGSWLCRMLTGAGAIVTGYALEPPQDPSLFSLAGLSDKMTSVIGDIRDIDSLKAAFDRARPEIVFHLAAQPIVRDSYKDPRYTYETNVMGTVNLLECVRLSDSVKSVVNVTTDKVYRNVEKNEGYKETDELCGFDPYSNSKSCSELVTQCYINSFFKEGIAVSTARAGNVLGGGDFANDRIIPDCVRAAAQGREIIVRNPYSVRPYQHLLEPLSVYLAIAKLQYEDISYAGSYNVGPDDCDCITTGELVDLFCKYWGEGAAWRTEAEEGAPHEAGLLKLDCQKLRSVISLFPRTDIEKCMELTCRLYKVWLQKGNVAQEMDRQIAYFTA